MRIIVHSNGESGYLLYWSISFTFVYDSSLPWTMPTKSGAANFEPPQILTSATCLVEVQVCDVAGNCTSDTSDNNFYIVQPTTSSIKTMILWNSERINRCGNDPPCENASSNPQDRANKVAEEIWNYLYNQIDGQISKTYTNVQYIILVGENYQIPFYRIKDGTIIYPESTYPTEVGIDTKNTVGSALSQSYFLTDNYYSEYKPENSGLFAPHEKIYQNDFAIFASC